MDVTKGALTQLFNTLIADDDLKSIIPGFPGPYHRAPADPAWPYLTHKLDTLQGTDNATRPARYLVNAWDYGESTDRIWDIRARVVALVDLARFTIPNQGILRTWYATETWMPNEDINVMNLALVFEARYARAGEVRSIQNEKGNN